MKGDCPTGQSPQWAVVPMEEEEGRICIEFFYIFSGLNFENSHPHSLNVKIWSFLFIVFFISPRLNFENSHPHP
jgi:hypothetical protein